MTHQGALCFLLLEKPFPFLNFFSHTPDSLASRWNAVCTPQERGFPRTAFPSPLPVGRIFPPGSESKGGSCFCSHVFSSFFLTRNSSLGGTAGGLGSAVRELACIHDRELKVEPWCEVCVMVSWLWR